MCVQNTEHCYEFQSLATITTWLIYRVNCYLIKLKVPSHIFDSIIRFKDAITLAALKVIKFIHKILRLPYSGKFGKSIDQPMGY